MKFSGERKEIPRYKDEQVEVERMEVLGTKINKWRAGCKEGSY